MSASTMREPRSNNQQASLRVGIARRGDTGQPAGDN